jgi:hypothetical protein
LTVRGEIPFVGAGAKPFGRAEIRTIGQIVDPFDRVQGTSGTIALYMLQLVALEEDQRVQGGGLALARLALGIEGEILAGDFVGVNVVLFTQGLQV